MWFMNNRVSFLKCCNFPADKGLMADMDQLEERTFHFKWKYFSVARMNLACTCPDRLAGALKLVLLFNDFAGTVLLYRG